MPVSRPPILLLLAVGLCLAAPALAQTPNAAPTREGNVWDGRDHEPDPATVPEGSHKEQLRQDSELQKLDRQLQSRVPPPGTGAADAPVQ